VKKIEFSFWKNSEMKKIMINNEIKMTWNGDFSL